MCAYQPINTRQWRRGVSLDNNFLRPFYSTMSRVSRGYYYYVLRILHTKLTQADSDYPLYNFFFLYLILIFVQTTLITQLLATSTTSRMIFILWVLIIYSSVLVSGEEVTLSSSSTLTTTSTSTPTPTPTPTATATSLTTTSVTTSSATTTTSSATTTTTSVTTSVTTSSSSSTSTSTSTTTTSTVSLEPIPTPSTIIDVLSSEPEFSYFLRVLQRQGMVPLLNELENVTLLAPINLAFVGTTGIDWENNALKRYVVNQKLLVGNLDKDERVFDTLYKVDKSTNYLIRVRPDLESLEYVIDEVASIVDEDISAKHQYSYIQGIDHLLPIKPTMCQELMNSTNLEISLFTKMFQLLFVDEEMVSEKSKSNKKKKKKKPKKDLPRILPKSCEEFLNGTQTILIPSNELVKQSLSELQLNYYLANDELDTYSSTTDSIDEVKHDVYNLLTNLMFSDLVVGKNGTGESRKSKYGISHKFELQKHHLTVDGVTSNSTHVFSNGAIHIFDANILFFEKLSIPVVEMIPRKALYALHYSNFVEELYFRSLDYLIDGSTAQQTVFLNLEDRDDAEDDDDDDNEITDVDVYISEPSIKSFSSRQNLLYQFVNSSFDLQDDVHILLDTKLCSHKRIGGCYKLKLSASHGTKTVTVNDDVRILNHLKIANDTSIFIANGEILPPTNLKHSLGDLISSGAVYRHLESIEIDRTSCLKTLEYINAFDLYSLDDNNKGYTIFLPCGTTKFKNLWTNLGLVQNYLKNNPKIHQSVMKGLFLEGLVYSDFNSSTKLSSLNGDSVLLEKSSVLETPNSLYYNNTALDVELNSDLLFLQGVIHVINEVLFPDSFEIPIEELIRTTFDSNFPDHFMWDIIKMYPNIHKSIVGKKPYSLLIPTAESLKDFNITTSFKDILKFVDLHLIPNEEVHKLLNCIDDTGYNNSVIRTNFSEGGLVCKHKPNTNKVMLQLHKLNGTSTESYSKDHEVVLLNHGCTKLYTGDNNTDSLSCVFLLQKPLNLEWFNEPKRGDNFLHVHLGWVSVGAGVILGLMLFGGIMVGLVFCLGKREKSSDKDDMESPRADSGFMSVLTDEDEFIPYDRGYETDVDVLRTETDALLPSHMKRKKKIRKPDYGSTTNSINGTNGSTTLPRDIGNIRSTLNRERNIPGY